MVDGGSQDLSPSEHDDSSEKMGLISEAASPPLSHEQPPPDLASAISSWVQFEDDTPWASTLPPHKEAGGTGRTGGGLCSPGTLFHERSEGLPAFYFACSRALKHWREQTEISSGLIL